MTTAIHVDGLGKRYRLGMSHAGSLREVTARFIRRFARHSAAEPGPAETNSEFWALRDVSFTVRSGEVVGIIGRNGAGKSTLLKILSGITHPTTGRVRMDGRVASLLEVGSGFHPELSGRENVFLNGAILGMTRREIRERFDAIVAFAELDRFVDTPVKRYSSGMYVRLAFAVAAHLDPEILIVDEVLAVGDAAFQKKCLSKMSEVSTSGRTVLFVSHNLVAVRTLCQSCILLEGGRFLASGTPEAITARYTAGTCPQTSERRWHESDPAAGTDLVRVQATRIIHDAKQSDTELLTCDSNFELEVEWQTLHDKSVLNFSLMVCSSDDTCAFATVSPQTTYEKGGHVSRCRFPGGLLNAGTFRLHLLVVQDASRVVLNLQDACVIEIHERSRDVPWFGNWPGLVRPKLDWQDLETDECGIGEVQQLKR